MSVTAPEASRQEQLAANPEAVAVEARAAAGRLPVDDTLVYTPFSRHGYYRDLLADRGIFNGQPGAHERLVRHAEQMEQIQKARSARAKQASGVEFRAEPDRTDGQGGYFAPPAWLTELFATADRPGRMLASLVRRLPLPAGVSSVNVPIIATGSLTKIEQDNAAVKSQDLTDTADGSTVATIGGFVDIALQVVELSPVAAAADWAIFMDLAEATDAELEYQLVMGAGGTGIAAELLGVAKVAGSNQIVYTDGTPTGSKMYPYFGQAFAQIGNNRKRPPECWLMRSSRWANLKTSEDTAGLPFDIGGISYLGSTVDTPDPVGGLLGLPVFPADAIPNDLTATTSNNVTTFDPGGSEDVVIALRPREILLLEGDPVTSIDREPLSATGGLRLTSHVRVGALTARRPAGISVLSGTGMSTPAGF